SGGDAQVAAETRATLAHTLESVLRALHPMIPFITEEIWQRLPKAASAPKSIMTARYPEAAVDGLRAPEVEQEMQRLQAVIAAARSVRAEYDVHPRRELPLILRSSDAAVRAALAREQGAIAALCNARVQIEAGEETPPDHALSVAEGVTVLVPLADLVDVA